MATISMLYARWIRKHCNDSIFKNKNPSVTYLVSIMMEEATTWARVGATGMANMYPPG